MTIQELLEEIGDRFGDAEKMVEVQRFDRVVRADSVLRCESREACCLRCFIGCVSARLIRLGDEGVMLFSWDNVEFFRHRG